MVFQLATEVAAAGCMLRMLAEHPLTRAQPSQRAHKCGRSRSCGKPSSAQADDRPCMLRMHGLQARLQSPAETKFSSIF